MKRLTIFVGVVALLAPGCVDRDLPEWMIGVFSSAKPGPTSERGFERYRIEEGGDVICEYFSDYSVTDARSQTWEAGDGESITLFPGPDDQPDVQEHYSWTITRAGRCGPYTVDTYYDGHPSHGTYELFRGELCARPITVPCNGECECCDRYWCEPPPPCE